MVARNDTFIIENVGGFGGPFICEGMTMNMTFVTFGTWKTCVWNMVA
jgi:hypothetical protein